MQGDPARTGAEVITLGAPGDAPSVEAVPGPNTARTYEMAVVLPTGEVAVFGGATTAVEFSDATAVLNAGVVSLLLLSRHNTILFFRNKENHICVLPCTQGTFHSVKIGQSITSEYNVLVT
jgi:hypothetical protein